MPRFDQPIEPMTLGNMRELGPRVGSQPLANFLNWKTSASPKLSACGRVLELPSLASDR
jgi:hypothetical protein